MKETTPRFPIEPMQNDQFNNKTTESELVGHAIERNPNAFGQLYTTHYPQANRYIGFRISSPEAGEDLTQNVFLHLWSAIDRYRQTSSPFAAWLFTITHNMVINYYRRNEEDIRFSDLPSEPKEESSDMLTVEVKDVIRHLPSKNQRTVLALRLFDGLPHKEIGARMGKSASASRAIMHRGLRNLRRELTA